MNKHQAPINFIKLVDPAHKVCAEFNEGNKGVWIISELIIPTIDQMQKNNALLCGSMQFYTMK